MERLPRDLIQLIAIDLDYGTILKLCYASKRFNEIICKSPNFWRNKLSKEFPKIDISEVKEFKNLYSYLSKKAEVFYLENYLINLIPPYYYQEINDVLKGVVENELLQIGDIVKFSELPLESHVWTGTEFKTDYEDGYFVSSSVFSFPKFSPNFWHGILLDNCLAYLYDPEKEKTYIQGIFLEKYKIAEHYSTYVDKGEIFICFNDDYTVSI